MKRVMRTLKCLDTSSSNRLRGRDHAVFTVSPATKLWLLCYSLLFRSQLSQADVLKNTASHNMCISFLSPEMHEGQFFLFLLSPSRSLTNGCFLLSRVFTFTNVTHWRERERRNCCKVKVCLKLNLGARVTRVISLKWWRKSCHCFSSWC